MEVTNLVLTKKITVKINYEISVGLKAVCFCYIWTCVHESKFLLWNHSVSDTARKK